MVTITPWEVKAAEGEVTAINYDHLITQFGCQKYTEEHTNRLTAITNKPVHTLLRRGLSFAHRGFEAILSCMESGKPFYLYTGRGPSSGSMHIGHAIPFMLCQYFQSAFGVPVVIQMTDDEKFLCKDITLDEARSFCVENIKDIIAFGFNPEKTYIFSNFESSHLFMENTLKLSKVINLNEAMKVFGFDLETSIGIVEFPARQIAAAYSSSFPFLPADSHCLIPCAVDQDPYFRLARDKAFAMNAKKPATLYVSLLPDLQGVNRKMSASDPKSSIYLSDTPKMIKEKINKYAFSGGKRTLEEHRMEGGDPSVDVAFQYLRFFLEDDQELAQIHDSYKRGEMLTGEMKSRCIDVVQAFVTEFQKRRAAVDDAVVKQFMSFEKFN